MSHKHGLLESIILNALWELERVGLYKNSVKDVHTFIKSSNANDRAYTTIKTVMDRMFEKNLLLRIKQGKKFYYRTNYSTLDIVKESLEKVANQYCAGNMSKLLYLMQEICENTPCASGYTSHILQQEESVLS